MTVDDLVDVFLLLKSPAGGDQLQGVKKGVVEVADVVCVTKADGALLHAARHQKAELVAALKLVMQRTEGWQVPVHLVSPYRDHQVRPKKKGKVPSFTVSSCASWCC